LRTVNPSARVWAYKVDSTATHHFSGTNFPDPPPSGRGYPGAFAWQLAMICTVSLSAASPNDQSVDIGYRIDG
jgi:hypothetical protein